MNVIRTFVPDSFQNYNHIVYCPITREASVVDPFDAKHMMACANEHNLTIKQIWITHEHGDHIRHLTELKDMTGAQVHAPLACQQSFSADNWLADGQSVQLGSYSASHYLTPGHTKGHGIFTFFNQKQPELDFAICGDTLFNAGVGNTRSGDTTTLFQTITRLTQLFTKTTRIFNGHDYITTNLKFTLNHCPNLDSAKKMLELVTQQTADTRVITTWADELKYNLFLRLDAQEVETLTNLRGSDSATNLNKFIHLRQLRDNW